MAKYKFRTMGVCSRSISFSIEDGKLHDIAFEGGCNGNLNAISKLLEGADAKWAADKLRYNDCGGRGTSCADQFSRAVDMALQKEQ